MPETEIIFINKNFHFIDKITKTEFDNMDSEDADMFEYMRGAYYRGVNKKDKEQFDKAKQKK